MGELISEIRRCRVQFVALLRDLEDEGSAIKVMKRIGCDNAHQDEGCTYFCRRLCTQMSAGVFRRLELRLQSLPYRLWVLTAGTTEGDKERVIDEFLAARECCSGWFGRRLRQLFSTKQALRGSCCKLVLASWMRSLVFNVYACEREHASMRRLISGVKLQPRRPRRSVPTERGCLDPCVPEGAAAAASGKRQRLPPTPHDDSADSPLYAPSAQLVVHEASAGNAANCRLGRWRGAAESWRGDRRSARLLPRTGPELGRGGGGRRNRSGAPMGFSASQDCVLRLTEGNSDANGFRHHFPTQAFPAAQARP